MRFHQAFELKSINSCPRYIPPFKKNSVRFEEVTE
jgi:hypothetical protein